MDFYRPASTQATLEALSSMNRAVRAWKFYPKGHPTRRNSLDQAYSALLQLLDGNSLLLSSGRTGFSFPNGDVIKDSTGQSAALAHELFVRRVLKITFCHDLLREDLLEFIKAVCLSPEVIHESGGFDSVMAARGIRTIWVNEFDLAAIRGKIEKIEQSGIFPQGVDEDEIGDEAFPEAEQFTYQTEISDPEHELQTLLGRLLTCTDDDIYLILVRQSVACAESLKSQQKYDCLFPLVELLASHASDEWRSVRKGECAQFALEQVIASGDFLQIALERAGREHELSHKALHALLKAGGDAAITQAAELLGQTESLAVRKALSTLLGTMGEAAVPPLLKFMDDSRWFIIRNICAILGVIGSHNARAALISCLRHPDLRVRKEAVRGLANLGGHKAEDAILAILRDTDAPLYPQAIASLGGMKSRRALAELMIFVFSRDLFLKSLSLKIEALASIAAIGDTQVTPYLVTLLDERFLLAPTRGRQLKTAVALCLGKLGDERAVPRLNAHVSSGGEFGAACSNALLLIEKQGKQ
ncbi:MAG: HEAT repeat domain-containing protein [Desulfuromonadaceae bacterium]|nr:HEAT repeat domain-containing protein [Desulfuromonadaceae bacterium]